MHLVRTFYTSSSFLLCVHGYYTYYTSNKDPYFGRLAHADRPVVVEHP